MIGRASLGKYRRVHRVRVTKVNMAKGQEEEVWREVLANGNKQRVMDALRGGGIEPEGWPSTQGGIRDAAVLVPMVMVDEQPSVLFTVRSQLVSRHRQQVR
jgi:hypothetical protein